MSKAYVVELKYLKGDNVVEFHDDKGQCILTVMRESTEKQQYLAVVVDNSRATMSVETMLKRCEDSADKYDEFYPREVIFRA